MKVGITNEGDCTIRIDIVTQELGCIRRESFPIRLGINESEVIQLEPGQSIEIHEVVE